MNIHKPNLHNPEPCRLARVKELAPEASSFSSPPSDAGSPTLNNPIQNYCDGQHAMNIRIRRKFILTAPPRGCLIRPLHTVDLRPVSKFQINTITAITSNVWMSPPPTLSEKPSSHRIIRTTKMVQSMLTFLSKIRLQADPA